MQKYKDGSSRNERGLAVILYVFKDGEKMAVCCNEKHEIIPEKMVSGNMDFSVCKANVQVEIYSNKTSRVLFGLDLVGSDILTNKRKQLSDL